ncbi:nipblb, partial [Symbiodinium sp. CCMP2456]
MLWWLLLQEMSLIVEKRVGSEKLAADTFMRRARPDPPEDPLPVSKRKSKSGKRKAGPWLNTDCPMNSDSWDEPVQPNVSTGTDVVGPKLGAFALKAFKVPTQKQLEFWQTDSESMPARHHLPNPKGQRMLRRPLRQEQWMRGDWPPVKEELAPDRAGANPKEEAEEVKTTDANSKVGTAAESGDWLPRGAKAAKDEVAPEPEKDVRTTGADSKVATAAVGGGGVKEEVAPKEEAKVRMSNVDSNMAAAADPTPSSTSPFEEHRQLEGSLGNSAASGSMSSGPVEVSNATVQRQRQVKEEAPCLKEVKMTETGLNVSVFNMHLGAVVRSDGSFDNTTVQAAAMAAAGQADGAGEGAGPCVGPAASASMRTVAIFETHGEREVRAFGERKLDIFWKCRSSGHQFEVCLGRPLCISRTLIEICLLKTQRAKRPFPRPFAGMARRGGAGGLSWSSLDCRASPSPDWEGANGGLILRPGPGAEDRSSESREGVKVTLAPRANAEASSAIMLRRRDSREDAPQSSATSLKAPVRARLSRRERPVARLQAWDDRGHRRVIQECSDSESESEEAEEERDRDIDIESESEESEEEIDVDGPVDVDKDDDEDSEEEMDRAHDPDQERRRHQPGVAELSRLAGVGRPTSPPRVVAKADSKSQARESPAAPARYAAVESYSEEDDVEAEAAEGDADGMDDEDEEQEEDDDDEESSSSPEKVPSPRSRRKDKKEEEEHRRRQDAAAAAAAKAAESKKAQKVVQAANRSDWQRIQQLRATSKVQKTPFFDVEMNAALACGQYKAGTALYEQLCKLKLPKEVLTFNLATKLYGKAGMWASVQQVWKEARKSYRMDETMAAARLVAAADEGDIRTAADILDEMVRMDLVVDVGHFTSALRACATAENSGHNAAVFLFDTLLNMSLTPDVQVFTALVSTFAGRPVSKFQKLRRQMDQFGVKHNWVFADAFLKALLVVPQKDKQSSVVELVDLMSGLSEERLREAASALSSFKTLTDEWSAFCDVTEKSSKTATRKSEQRDSLRKPEEKSRHREGREKPRQSEASRSRAEERMKEKQREARAREEMQEKEKGHEPAKSKKKKKGGEPEQNHEGSRRDASTAMERSREKAPSTSKDEARRESRRKDKASRDEKSRRKEEKEAADREASRKQEEARAAKQKEKERDEVKKREEEERRERARKEEEEEEQRRREQEKEEERRRQREREEERRLEKEREEEKQREKQRLEEELRRERERREREEEKRREKERAEREEREERERRREQEREEERRREKERQEREEKRREEERREKEREQKRREREREEERRREKDREEERRREKDREEERRREKDRDDDRRRDRDREDERRRESGRDDRRRDKDREDDRRRDKDRENEHRRDRDRHEERDRHEKDRDKDRDKDKYREKDRGRERERSRDRDDRERERDRDREKDTGRDRDRSKPRERERSKQRERSRPRDRERDRDDRDRNRHDNERDTRNKDRAKERERERERDKDRARERERERDRDRDADDRRKKDGQRQENGSKKARSVTPLPGRTQPPPASDADGAAFPPPLPTSDRKGGQYDPERLPSSSPAA